MPKKQPEGLAHAAIRMGLPLIAAIYDRVSKDRHGRGKSVGEQDEENRDACAENGWKVLDPSYVDNDVSASRFSTREREDWLRLVEDLKARRFHVLVIWEIPRADRTFERYVMFVAMCRDIGILVHVTSQERTYDPRKYGDWKALITEGLESASESERTSTRTSRDTRGAAKAGRPHGATLFGYRREYGIDEKGRRYLVGQFPDEELHEAVSVDGLKVTTYSHAGVVEEASKRVAGGDAFAAVAADFNYLGIPTPKNATSGWSGVQIRQMVTRAAYAGRRVHQGIVQPGVKTMWPPLVDAETFEACVAIASAPSRRSERSTALKHLGSGLFVCGVGGCDRTVRVTQATSRRPTSYVCWPSAAGRRNKEAGYHVSRSKADVDAYVERSIFLRLVRDDIADLLAEDRRAEERASAIVAEIAELQGRVDRAADACAQGLMSEAMAGRIEAQLLPRIKHLRSEMSQARVAPVLRGLVGLTLAEVEAEYRSRSLPEQRAVIRALTERVEILPVGRRPPHLPKLPMEESVNIVWRQPKTG